MFSIRPAKTSMGAQTLTAYTPKKTGTHQPVIRTEEHVTYNDDSNDDLVGEGDLVAQPVSDKGKAPVRSRNSLTCDAAEELIVPMRSLSELSLIHI